jgi:hypothetical protein
METRAIIELVKQTPQIQQAVDVIEEQLARSPITPEDLTEMIQMLEAVVEAPERYAEVRQAAIVDGLISEEDAPVDYDPQFVLALLIALYGYQERLGAQGYARGGLRVAGRRLQSAGRGGDSMLAHINPREAEMLRRMGGAGTVNPNTGLQEYKSVKKILGVVAPIALSFIAPGLGTAIGAALGASGVAAAAIGGAVIGGATAGLTGGNVVKGAAFGALGSGLSGATGSAINKGVGLGLGQGAQNVLGGAVLGGSLGAATGQGFGKGALMGGAGQLAGNLAAGNTFGGGLGAGVTSGGQTFGNMLTAGYDPKTAAIGGGLAGLTSGLRYKPSDAVVQSMQAPESEFAPAPTTPVDVSKPPGFLDQILKGGPFDTGAETGAPPTETGAPPTETAGPLSGLVKKAIVPLALAGGASLISSRPADVEQAIGTLPPEQKEYFNRPSVVWDWQRMQNDANAQNMSLSQYMASYWPQVTSGSYNKPPAMAMGGVYARGGAGPLGAVARLARGAGTGREDTINARLSDGEYVIDAETVAMLGDGSTKAGAKRLDEMRSALRKHKGGALAKGKFSPNAKSPLAYLKGAM